MFIIEYYCTYHVQRTQLNHGTIVSNDSFKNQVIVRKIYTVNFCNERIQNCLVIFVGSRSEIQKLLRGFINFKNKLTIKRANKRSVDHLDLDEFYENSNKRVKLG